MPRNVYLYLLIMAAVTYLIRVLPLTVIRCEIKTGACAPFSIMSPM
ncbi:hypothetical protein HMPREF1006_02326 [Synergistes sp. 3_1_syn1]|nr:hypothetical protein HMPREF1006_02326 [Synergistes sp. 3_1_syn1]